MYDIASTITDAFTMYSPCLVFAEECESHEVIDTLGKTKVTNQLTYRGIQTFPLLARKEGGILDGAYKQDPRYSQAHDTQPICSYMVSHDWRGGSMRGRTAKKSGAPARTPASNNDGKSNRSIIPNQQEAAEEFVVDYRQDSLPPITTGQYEAFIARGAAGIDALAVYMHLLYTYRRQHSDRVRATRAYLMRGLSMGRPRVIAARKLLDEMGLTAAYATKDEKGRITGHYIRLCLQPNPGPKSPQKSTVQVFHTVDRPPAGFRHQMLEEEIQSLEETNEKKREPQTPEPVPHGKPSLAQIAPQNSKDQKTSPSRAAALGEISRRALGRETDYVGQAIALLPEADHEEVLQAWEIMLTECPAGAAFFAKDYATRWAPKARKAIARRAREGLNRRAVKEAREALFVARRPGDEEAIRELAAALPWRRSLTKLQPPLRPGGRSEVIQGGDREPCVAEGEEP
jgi:hypothetical protein